MKKTLDEMKHAIALINSYRKPSTASSYVWQTAYEDYTDIECHAELVIALISAIQSFVTLIYDQSIGGFIKAAVRIR